MPSSGPFIAPSPVPDDESAVPKELVPGAAALVPEVLVKDDQYAVVRPRIEVDELIAMDRPAPWL